MKYIRTIILGLFVVLSSLQGLGQRRPEISVSVYNSHQEPLTNFAIHLKFDTGEELDLAWQWYYHDTVHLPESNYWMTVTAPGYVPWEQYVKRSSYDNYHHITLPTPQDKVYGRGDYRMVVAEDQHQILVTYDPRSLPRNHRLGPLLEEMGLRRIKSLLIDRDPNVELYEVPWDSLAMEKQAFFHWLQAQPQVWRVCECATFECGGSYANEIIVKLKYGATWEDIDPLLKQHGLEKTNQSLDNRETVYRCTKVTGLETFHIADLLNEDPRIELAHPNTFMIISYF